MDLDVPAQRLTLEACDNDGRYVGEMKIGPNWFHVEAYAIDNTSDTTDDLIRDLDRLASYGEALETIQIDGRDCVLVVHPKSV